MKINILEKHQNRYLFYLLLYLIVTIVAVTANMPVLREILSIVLLTFVPGLLILNIIGIKQFELLDIIVFSVGLSEAFLMLYGWLFNEVCIGLGVSKPLTPVYLLPGILAPVLIMLVINYFKQKEGLCPACEYLKKISSTEKLLAAISTILPIAGVTGIYALNRSGSNLIVLITLIAIPAFLWLLFIMKEKEKFTIYPYVILMIGSSLALMWAVRSNHIIGTDAHLEYRLFLHTLELGQWNSNLITSSITSCLSISIIPTIYQVFTNIDPEYLFKILYPMIFSFCPVVVYSITRAYVNNFYAFLASFIFMSFTNFQMTTAHARTNFAIFFFSLLILLIIDGKMSFLTRKALFIIFTITIVMSHYSTAYILLFILSVSWLIHKIILLLRERKIQKGKLMITFTIVCIMLGLIFVWYSFVTIFPFQQGVTFIWQSLTSLKDMFILESRNVVPGALGVGLQSKGMPQRIEFVADWSVIILMIAGNVICCWLYMKKKIIAGMREVSGELLAVGIVNLIILCVAALVPFVTHGYDINRVYLMVTVILSCFAVFGLAYLTEYPKIRTVAKVLFMAVVTMYYLSQTGLTYQLYGDKRSMILNDSGLNYDLYYLHEEETAGVRWLKQYSRDAIYSDYCNPAKLMADNIDISYDKGIVAGKIENKNGLLYLLYHTAIDNKVIDNQQEEYLFNKNITNNLNGIYQNGGSSVYENK